MLRMGLYLAAVLVPVQIFFEHDYVQALAGLSIADVMQRIRPLMRDETLSPRDARRRLVQELDELSRVLGFE